MSRIERPFHRGSGTPRDDEASAAEAPHAPAPRDARENPPRVNPWGQPGRPPRRDEAARGHAPRSDDRPRGDDAARSAAPRRDQARGDDRARAPSHGREELRIFGVNACLAVYAKRPHAIRKAYVAEAQVPRFGGVLAYLAQQRVGYRVVGDEDLAKLTQSQHHEGVCFDVVRTNPMPLSSFLERHAGKGNSLVVVLDGVGNPHNFGAVLRSAAHFGVDALLLPQGSPLALTGAACRVAEGGAESVPLVAAGSMATALPALARAGYGVAATVVRDGTDLYRSALPKRLAVVFGAESTGISAEVGASVARRLVIPGTGSVESLNIAAAFAIVTAEWWRQSHER